MPQPSDIVIVAAGMITPVGLSAPETAASVRSTVARFAETCWMDKRFEPFTMAEVPDEALPELAPALAAEKGLTSREGRMLRLAAPPLRECLKSLKVVGQRPALVLALPEMETTLPINRTRFLQRLAAQTEGAFDAARSDASATGRAGGLAAMGRAIARLRDRKENFVIAGGVDSFRDLYIMGTLDLRGRVKSNSNLDGFIPGEGAGFLLLTQAQTATRMGLKSLATLSSVAAGVEPGHMGSEKPYMGDGLDGCFKKLFQESAPRDKIQEVYSSMNGENFWAKEWGVAFLRNQAMFNHEHGMYHPADCFGDTGAACGAVMTGLAALGLQKGYRRGPVLVYASSDGPERSAVLVGSAQGG